jgi:glucose/arabinose dehydrogenase
MTLRSHSVPRGLLVVSFVLFAVAPVVADESTIFAPIEPLGGFPIHLTVMARGLGNPLKGKVAPGEPGRLYVVNQGGKLTAVDLASGHKTPFLDLTSRLVDVGTAGPGTFDERGFLGVAFHPDYRHNGKLYTYTSEPVHGAPTFPTTLPPNHAPDHQNVVAEWRANCPGRPDSGVNLASRRELLRVDWPQFNHNAGDITFGPDGLLYIPVGDGGGADDQDGEEFDDLVLGHPAPVIGHGDGNAQKLTRFFGKIHRIDVDGHNSANHQYGIPASNPFVGRGGGVLGEIYAYGLRNPYRISFDTATGRLFAGDVGQNDLEEVDVVVKGGNYGWHLKEGRLCFDPRGTDPGVATSVCPKNLPHDLIDPIAQYDTDTEGLAVIGGFIYHGTRFPALAGHYVFGDWSRVFNDPAGPDNYGRLFYLQQTDFTRKPLLDIKEFKNFADEADRLGLTERARPPVEFEQSLAVSGFAQDERGEVYLLGNETGMATGTSGVILRLGPGDEH